MPEDYFMTRVEIAEALGISEDAVKALLYRAMNKIRKQYPDLREWVAGDAG